MIESQLTLCCISSQHGECQLPPKAIRNSPRGKNFVDGLPLGWSFFLHDKVEMCKHFFLSSNWNLFRPLVKALFSNNAGTVNDGVKLPWNVCCRRQRQLKSQRMPIPQIQLIRRTYKSGQVDQSDKPEFWRFVHDRGQIEEIAKVRFHTNTLQVIFQDNSFGYLML